MRKKLLISVSLFLILALSLGITYGVMASSTDGEVGISLTIVGTEPPPTTTTTPPPTGELGFTVDPGYLTLGEVEQGESKSYYVTVRRSGSSSPIVVCLDLPSVPWGTITADHDTFLLSSYALVEITISVNDDATPGDYTTSVLFHR